jgi:glycerol-1-phosphate dehydrogenase [NAD(P)+]
MLAVMDPTIMRRDGEALKPRVVTTVQEAGWGVEPLVLQPGEDGQVHPDMGQVEAVKARLGTETAVLSVGSGVVTDIAKHACYLFEQETGIHLPFIVYQTANSVSAFTSNGAPLFVQGVKRTFPSRYPDALVCDLETLRDAPRDMTIAGVGDMLAIYTSFADWFLAHELGMDPTHSGIPAALLGPLDRLLTENAQEVGAGSLEGMALLAKLITLGGLAMSLSHATSPLSGYEHLISHILDLQNELAGQPLPLHGTQIILATAMCAAAYQAFIRDFTPEEVDPSRCFPSPDAMERLIRQTYLQIDPSGRAGEECWSDYRKKLEKWNADQARMGPLIEGWDRIRPELERRTRSPRELIEIFKAVGGPGNFSQMDPPANEAPVKFAFLNSPFMRNRFTLGDLLVFLNWERETLWERAWKETQIL